MAIIAVISMPMRIENLENNSRNLLGSSKHQINNGGKVRTIINGPLANNPNPKAIKNR